MSTKTAVSGESEKSTSSSHKFGTFKGVFIPSILTIFGVIMYLRLGWVVGQVGYFATAVIITLASTITFLTGLSISATATNMKVGGGGAYFMISRSFGLESGAAIGIPLFLAQALGISFYLAGFAESVTFIFPDWNPTYIALVSLVLITALATYSANFALKTQLFIFIIIISSLVSFFLGDTPAEGYQYLVKAQDNVPFWVVFAVFFPAVTGIEAGISMSGDLKNPAKALPLGTLLAVIIGYVVYLIIPLFLLAKASPMALKSNPMIMGKIALYEEVIMAGLWGATLSSALGALLGAPRTLQALAKDRVMPGLFGVGYGAAEAPRNATILTFIIAAGGILLGDLNAIAPVLSMFFLTSYGFLNLSAGIEGLINNPSWRPSFKTPWFLSLIGAFACLGAMLMINPGATFVATFACIFIYWITQRRNLNPKWQDMRRSILLYLARLSIYRLSKTPTNEKSWRPNILLFSGNPTNRWHLVEFADTVGHGQGFLSVTAVVEEKLNQERVHRFEKTIREFMQKKGVEALVTVSPARNVSDGMKQFVQSYGLGPIEPNIVLTGEPKDDAVLEDFVKFLMFTYKVQKNLVVLCENNVPEPPAPEKKWYQFSKERTRHIDVWWGRQKQNAGLMLALGYMIQTNPRWKNSILNLKTLISNNNEETGAQAKLSAFIQEGRINAATSIHHMAEHSEPLDVINEKSSQSDLVFIGLRPPDPDEDLRSYMMYFRTLREKTRKIKQIAFVLSAERVEFEKIFS